MIAALIAASLTAQTVVTDPVAAPRGALPCQAVPSLCIASFAREQSPRLALHGSPEPSGKMAAYRLDPWPCRLVGNMGCPKKARSEIVRLGEPIDVTLSRTLGLQ